MFSSPPFSLSVRLSSWSCSPQLLCDLSFIRNACEGIGICITLGALKVLGGGRWCLYRPYGRPVGLWVCACLWLMAALLCWPVLQVGSQTVLVSWFLPGPGWAESRKGLFSEPLTALRSYVVVPECDFGSRA